MYVNLSTSIFYWRHLQTLKLYHTVGYPKYNCYNKWTAIAEYITNRQTEAFFKLTNENS